MFYNCYKLTSIDLSNFNFNYTKDLSYMFYNCINLEIIKWNYDSNFFVANYYSYMFYNCYKLSSIDLSYFNFYNAKLLDYMFFNCTKLEKIEWKSTSLLKNNDLKSFHVYRNMFSGCISLSSLDLSNFILDGTVDLSSMFYNCIKLTSIELTGNLNWTKTEYFFTDPRVLRSWISWIPKDFHFIRTSVNQTFKNCYSLKELNLLNINININYTDNILENTFNLEGCLYSMFNQNISKCSKYMGFRFCGKCLNDNFD
jgi:hypothetical protein